MRKLKLKRKVKLILFAGVAAAVITGALTIWAAVAAFDFVYSQASRVAESPATREHMREIEGHLKDLPKFKALSCWDQTQHLIAVRPWLERPATENLTALKVACLEKNNDEGRTI